MKKVILSMLLVSYFGIASQALNQEPEKKVTHNKATKTTKNAGEKTGKGIKHGAYDVTHNKATEKTNINEGNKKYSKQNDINTEHN